MRKLIRRKATQMMTFNAMVVSAITLIVGVLIFNSVNGALPSDGTGAINATTTIVPQIESAFTLAPIVLVVLVASLILAQVAQFRGSN